MKLCEIDVLLREASQEPKTGYTYQGIKEKGSTKEYNIGIWLVLMTNNISIRYMMDYRNITGETSDNIIIHNVGQFWNAIINQINNQSK